MLVSPKPPPHDELEALIKEARARQLRRRLLAVAVVAISAGIGLSLHALVGGDSNPSATGGSAGGGVPACRAPQLATVAEGGQGMGAGHGGASFQIVDTSSNACVLPAGLPAMTFTLRGRTVPMEERLLRPPYSGLGPRAGHVLTPGRKVTYIADWSGACQSFGPAVTRGEKAVVALRFRNGLRIATYERTPENVPVVPDCKGEPPQTVLVTPLLKVVA